jgi:hypothetical protein
MMGQGFQDVQITDMTTGGTYNSACGKLTGAKFQSHISLLPILALVGIGSVEIQARRASSSHVKWLAVVRYFEGGNSFSDT